MPFLLISRAPTRTMGLPLVGLTACARMRLALVLLMSIVYLMKETVDGASRKLDSVVHGIRLAL